MSSRTAKVFLRLVDAPINCRSLFHCILSEATSIDNDFEIPGPILAPGASYNGLEVEAVSELLNVRVETRIVEEQT